MIDVDISKIAFDMTKLETVNSRHTPEQKMAAVIAFVMTGNGREASELAAVPYTAFRKWKQEAPWWADAVNAAQKYLNQKLDGKLTKIIDRIIKSIEENLDKGEEKMTSKGNIIRLPPSTQALVQALTAIHSIRERTRQAAYSIKEQEREGEVSLDDLRSGFAKLSSPKVEEK